MTRENNPTEENKSQFSFVFEKTNYIIMTVGVVLLILGYALLTGGGSDDPNVFNEAMFDARRLYWAPILIILGLLAEIVAIMYNGKKRKND